MLSILEARGKIFAASPSQQDSRIKEIINKIIQEILEGKSLSAKKKTSPMDRVPMDRVIEKYLSMLNIKKKKNNN